MFDFLIFDIFLTTWHLFDILTHQLNLNHLSPHRAIFSAFKIVKCVFSLHLKTLYDFLFLFLRLVLRLQLQLEFEPLIVDCLVHTLEKYNTIFHKFSTESFHYITLNLRSIICVVIYKDKNKIEIQIPTNSDTNNIINLVVISVTILRVLEQTPGQAKHMEWYNLHPVPWTFSFSISHWNCKKKNCHWSCRANLTNYTTTLTNTGCQVGGHIKKGGKRGHFTGKGWPKEDIVFLQI